eukprot:COSAG01_NODE_32779_length_575_cov_1.560924_1_plen_75_part_10
MRTNVGSIWWRSLGPERAKVEKDHRDDINHLWSNSSEELDHANVAGQPEENVHDLVSKMIKRICEDDKCIQRDME